MGLTNSSIGIKAVDMGLAIKKQSLEDKVIALAGNPNVGKSTVFNGLTGMNQHTGNWPGKTVTNAQGRCTYGDRDYILVDLPGTYSLMAHSAEEEVARNFICFGNPDAVIVVCDATCLERNLNLVLQTMEIAPKVLVCVNLMDEARRKNIRIDLAGLSRALGVPVVSTVARKKKSLAALMKTLEHLVDTEAESESGKMPVVYPAEIEAAISQVESAVSQEVGSAINSRWLSLKLLERDESLLREIEHFTGMKIEDMPGLRGALEEAKQNLEALGITPDGLKDKIVATLMNQAGAICKDTVTYEKSQYAQSDRRADRILTSKLFGYPLMLLLLAFIFWLTITGANVPSDALAKGLFWVQDQLTDFFYYIHAPEWLHGLLVLGGYRVLAWVVSVMLPPMAIFFPLFTLLEDVGYLPRIAYNLDKPFKRCGACGKQALTTCMGFGCNAAGIVGCRIIDSPRERLLAILTNNFVPCNGRFPTLITILTMFFVGTVGGMLHAILPALLLTLVILLGIGSTFAVTKLLSRTLLKGVPSSFTLELPPYRRPQIGKVIIRSVFDRTLFVLGRAAAVAAPAGMLLWIMANVQVEGVSLLNHCAHFLDPFAGLMGLDGVILIAFILGFPANEIVIPIIIMAYLAQGSLMEMDSLAEMKALFTANGWTWVTAVSTMLFTLMHWPCSTALLTVKKETGSVKWTFLAALIPTVCGVLLCMLFRGIVGIFGF